MLEHLVGHDNHLGEIVVDRENQQVRPTEAELGWLAGIIEGEGSLTMYVRKKVWNGWNGIGVDLAITIVNTDAAIIQKCKRIIEALDCSTFLFERKSVPVYKKDGTAYLNPLKTPLVINVSKMSHMLTVISAIYPYMFGEKKKRAELISEFIQRRMNRLGLRSKTEGKAWYDKRDWELVTQFYKITGGKLNPEVVSYLNEHTLSPKGMICSGLNGDIKNTAEMSVSTV